MRNLFKSSVATAICAAVAVTVMPSESLAGVMSVTGKSIISPSSPTEQIHFRRHRHHHHWRHAHWRHHYVNPAAAVVGGAAAVATAPFWAFGYPYYHHSYYHHPYYHHY